MAGTRRNTLTRQRTPRSNVMTIGRRRNIRQMMMTMMRRRRARRILGSLNKMLRTSRANAHASKSKMFESFWRRENT